MREYPKIETLLERDERFKVISGHWRLPEFAYLAEAEWLWTEKVDGTNVRVMMDNNALRFGGRTDAAQMPTFLLSKLQETFSLEGMVAAFTRNGVVAKQVCLYGEGYGAKIQKGGGNYKRDGVDFVLFDVWIDGWWLRFADVAEIADVLGIRCVPIVGSGPLHAAIGATEQGLVSTWGPFPSEGLAVGRRDGRVGSLPCAAWGCPLMTTYTDALPAGEPAAGAVLHRGRAAAAGMAEDGGE